MGEIVAVRSVLDESGRNGCCQICVGLKWEKWLLSDLCWIKVGEIVAVRYVLD